MKSFYDFLLFKENANSEPEQKIVTQKQLEQIYSQGKIMMFIKNTPVALVPFAKLKSMTTDQQFKEIMNSIGNVDNTSYEDEYLNKGFVVFQWDNKSNNPDVYVADPVTVSKKYSSFQGEMPNAKKVPSFTALNYFGINPNQVPLFVKKVPTEMIHAADVNMEGKRIQTNWGEQDVGNGGFLVKEENGHIYTVSPDEHGFPIGYIPFE